MNWELSSNQEDFHWNNISTYIMSNLDSIHDTWEAPHPPVLSTKVNTEDNPTWNMSMNGPHADHFFDTTVEEIDTLTKLKSWSVVPRQSHMNVLRSTWFF